MFSDAEVFNSADGLGRNGVMYAVHGNTESHTECLELMMSQAECVLDHQANGNYRISTHLVSYGAPNFSIDASVIDVLNPNDVGGIDNGNC